MIARSDLTNSVSVSGCVNFKESWSQHGGSLQTARSFCMISQGTVLGGGVSWVRELPSWSVVCFKTQHGLSTICYSGKQRILGLRVPDYSLCASVGPTVSHPSQAPTWDSRPREVSTMLCSDTCHLMCLSLSMPLQGRRTSQGDPCPMHIMGEAVGRRDPVGNGKERYGNMGAEGGTSGVLT